MENVRLIAARFVKLNKNDFVDAEAIAEAVERKNMRLSKSRQMTNCTCRRSHRVRDRLISRRTAVISQLRVSPLERGIVFAQKLAMLKAAMSPDSGERRSAPDTADA